MNQRLFGNATIYLTATVVNAAIPFALLPVLTRLLSPADYGVVAMFSLMLSIFGAFTGLSVHGAVSVRYFQLSSEELAEYVASCVGILVVSTAAMAALVAVFGPWFASVTGVPADWLLVGVATAGLQFLVNVRLTLWQVTGQAWTYGAFLVTLGLGNAALSLALILGAGLAWEGRAAGQSFTVAAFALLAAAQLARNRQLALPRQWRRHVADALRFGVPLIPHALGALAIAAADRFVIVNQLGTAEAGVYLVALQFAQAIGLATDSFNKSYAPWLTKRLAGRDSVPRVAIVRGTYAYFALVLAAAWLYGLVAPALMELLVGERFRAAGALVGPIALGYAFSGCYFMVTNYVFFENRTTHIATVTFISGLLNVALMYGLVKHQGLQGAALAFLLTNAFTFFATWWVAQRVHPMPWWSAIRPNLG
jgi:O-antigen/teichoic acid export membrane protein